eukprot:gnl/TRDRNA2_/TRDRNA2_177776_c2_seq14.p1 gnl/TRDRNA2_/TRDRNA2_177776_c2~~gnl/TRDRNA2_/TRDRNA2_177776_c2_seq14.p1  ORF type:complete len:267 (-),score=18.24 gnl/TRDRNA2_/TRDRNA2_177776_c2_seq14:343-1143(-)
MWKDMVFCHSARVTLHRRVFFRTLDKPGMNFEKVGYNQTMMVPDEFKDKGLFWWTSQVWTYLLRPDRGLRAQLAGLKEHLNWEAHRPILGMHVRHGDSCHKAFSKDRDCFPFETFMSKAREFAMLYGYKSIYLATDDADVWDQAANYSEFHFLHAPANRAQRRNTMEQDDKGMWVSSVKAMYFEAGAVAKEAREVLLDVHMLADTDGFIGQFTSSMARLAYSLSFGRRGCAIPLASLDSLWCNDFLQDIGKFLDEYSRNGTRTFYC